jgi:hypothetical protein
VSKQDRQGVRTPADLERKYQFGKTFAEIIGLASDLRESVDSTTSELSDKIGEVSENVSSITRDPETILMSAFSKYSKKGEFEEYKEEVKGEFEVLSDRISANFTTSTEKTETVEDDLKTVKEDLEKHFDFSLTGLVVRAEEGSMRLLVDNDIISFYKGEIDPEKPEVNRLGWWDGNSFHTGNIFIDVDEVAQFGNYGFVPYDDGESDGLDLVRVGG